MLRLQDFLEKLENVKQVGAEQWCGNCPACNDRHGHLYISSSADGTILLDCKHGCTFDEIVSAMGLQKKQLFKEKKPWELLREHVYMDGQGEKIAKKVLYRKDDGNKTAVWYRHEAGRWMSGLNGLKLPLYHMAAMAKSEKVYMVEGEKDVETMERLGFIATTSPNGAGSKLRMDLVKCFTDKDVVILADNDKVGIEYAQDTANRISAKAKSVKVIAAAEIYADVKPKGDVSDIAAEVGDDRAKEMLLAAESAERPTQTEVRATMSNEVMRAVNFFQEKGVDPLTYSFNDKGNSQLFADIFKNEARWNVTAKEWYVYDGGRWVRDTGGMRVSSKMKLFVDMLILYCQTDMDEHTNKLFIKNVDRMGQIKVRENILRDARDHNYIESADFDKFPFLINLKNGTLDLKTMEFRPHNPDDLLSAMANVTYDPDAKSPLWDKFINDIMTNDGDKKMFLQKALGYSLTGSTEKECFFMLYGATTRNGKGTLTGTISHMLGDYAAAAVPESFASHANKDGRQASGDIARLAGKRFVNVSEPQKNMHLDVALVKTLTGNDIITARHLHEREFEFKPQFKIFINSNYLPNANDDTLFSSDRVKVITFDRHFDDAERDTALKGKLCTEENISGIFNWCLKGLQMFYADGLEDPPSVAEATAEYRRESDKIQLFIEECLVADAGSNCVAKDVYIVYKYWCEENGCYPESKQKWLQAMRGKVTIKASARLKSNEKSVHNVIDCYAVADEYKSLISSSVDSRSKDIDETVELPF